MERLLTSVLLNPETEKRQDLILVKWQFLMGGFLKLNN